jgi:hypothetical protein
MPATGLNVIICQYDVGLQEIKRRRIKKQQTDASELIFSRALDYENGTWRS